MVRPVVQPPSGGQRVGVIPQHVEPARDSCIERIVATNDAVRQPDAQHRRGLAIADPRLLAGPFADGRHGTLQRGPTARRLWVVLRKVLAACRRNKIYLVVTDALAGQALERVHDLAVGFGLRGIQLVAVGVGHPVPTPINPWLPVRTAQHPVRVLAKQLAGLGDVRGCDPYPQPKVMPPFQLIRQPAQAVREALVGHPIPGDVAPLPAVVELHDLEAQRLEMLGGDGCVREHFLLGHSHPMRVPGTPQASGTGSRRTRTAPRQRLAISFKGLKRVGSRRQVNTVQLDRFPCAQHAPQESRGGRQRRSTLIHAEGRGQVGARLIGPQIADQETGGWFPARQGQHPAAVVFLGWGRIEPAWRREWFRAQQGVALDVHGRRTFPGRAECPSALVTDAEEFRGAETDFGGAAVDDAPSHRKDIAPGIETQFAFDAHAALFPGLEQGLAVAEQVVKRPGDWYRRGGCGIGPVNLYVEPNAGENDRRGVAPHSIPSAALVLDPDAHGAVRQHRPLRQRAGR